MTHKPCPLCQTNKPIDDFYSHYSNTRKKYRVGNYCKPCSRAKARHVNANYTEEQKQAKKQYAKAFRENPDNKAKIKEQKKKFKEKYKEELHPSYLRDCLAQIYGFDYKDLKNNPELIEMYKNHLKLKRKLRNGKK